jgi:hypothetical protein
MTGDYLNTPAPYSRTVEALLEHERVIVDRPAIVRARVLARARDSINGADRIAGKPSSSRYLVRVVVAAAAGVVVMVSAAAAYQMLRRPVSTQPSETRQPSASLAVPAPEPQDVPAPIGAASGQDDRSPSPAPSHRPARVAVEELRLLDRARQSDARADYTGVLSIAAEHERRFPDGRLAEEREVLRVRALVSLGRGGEARQAASRFRRQFPRSVLLRKVDDMLAPAK